MPDIKQFIFTIFELDNMKMFFGIRFILVFLVAGVFFVKADECGNKTEIVCYFGSWAVYRDAEGKFTTENIDPTLCTNIVYSFVGLNMDLELTSLDSNADINLGGFANLTQLKEQNPCLRATLAIGGWNEGSLKYSILASTDESRRNFAEKALRFISYYGFNGLDFDWEYPTTRGGIAQDKANLVALLKAIKERFEPWGYKLSVAVAVEDTYYDIPGIAEHVDYVHLMGYDLVSATSSITGLQAPFSIIKEKINLWLSKGLPASKLILGIPTYARCFNLADPNNHDIGAALNQTTCGGVWTDEDGFLAFYEVQEMVQNSYCQGTKVEDDNIYSWCSDVWMTYDNEITVGTKTQYALDEGLGGVMIWSLDTDDFSGMYGIKYTLLSAIYRTINKN